MWGGGRGCCQYLHTHCSRTHCSRTSLVLPGEEDGRRGEGGSVPASAPSSGLSLQGSSHAGRKRKENQD